MKWRNSKERELLSSGGSREDTLPSKDNPNPDLSDTADEPPSPEPHPDGMLHQPASPGDRQEDHIHERYMEERHHDVIMADDVGHTNLLRHHSPCSSSAMHISSTLESDSDEDEEINISWRHWSALFIVRLDTRFMLTLTPLSAIIVVFNRFH